MSAIPPTLENIQKAVSLIKEYYYETSPSINPLQSFLEETPNPLKGKCYICSATIQRIFGKENISLWRCEDEAIPKSKKHPQRFHWWCVTKDGVIIDVTEEQYTIEGRLSPAAIDGVEKEERNELWYPTLKDKVFALTTLISGKLLDTL